MDVSELNGIQLVEILSLKWDGRKLITDYFLVQIMKRPAQVIAILAKM